MSAQATRGDSMDGGMVERLWGLVLTGAVLTGSPGPAVLSLAATSAAFGTGRSVAYMAGLTLGMIGVMGIAATGAMGLLLSLPGATPIVTLVSVSYFAYLAFRIATAPPLAPGAPAGRAPSFSAGVLLSLVNPKAYAVMAALFSGFTVVRDRAGVDIALKMGVLWTIIAVANLLWLLAGGSMTGLLRKPRTSRIVNVTFAVLLVASVVFAMLM